ncbi:hypothetical protein BU15DRAFT_80693 [Melanogaster broomeanus]|nr:hypothetical protein BU15DRAFT_80693 [Melanogaster broomeanus]
MTTPGQGPPFVVTTITSTLASSHGVIVITATFPATTATGLQVISTTPPTTTIAPTSSNAAYVNIGAIVGSVVGGLVALLAITLIIFRFRRRGRSNRATIHVDSEPTVEPFVPTDVQERDAEPPSKHPMLQTIGWTAPAGLPPHQLGIGHSNTSDATNGGLSAPPPTDPSTNAFSPGASEPPRPQARRVQQVQPILTDDQADFVNSLHANNVPAAAIARVMERMMAGEQRPAIEGYAAAGGSLQPGHDHSHDSESAPPPSYDHVTSGE